MVVLGLALWVSSGAVGCGGGGGPGSPEAKEKQEVVQDKMKDFMKKSKLPNKPG
jgi:Fe-S oxidoreductase